MLRLIFLLSLAVMTMAEPATFSVPGKFSLTAGTGFKEATSPSAVKIELSRFARHMTAGRPEAHVLMRLAKGDSATLEISELVDEAIEPVDESALQHWDIVLHAPFPEMTLSEEQAKIVTVQGLKCLRYDSLFAVPRGPEERLIALLVPAKQATFMLAVSVPSKHWATEQALVEKALESFTVAAELMTEPAHPPQHDSEFSFRDGGEGEGAGGVDDDEEEGEFGEYEPTIVLDMRSELAGVDLEALLGAEWRDEQHKVTMQPPVGWEMWQAEDGETERPKTVEQQQQQQGGEAGEGGEGHKRGQPEDDAPANPGKELSYFFHGTSSLEVTEMPDEVPVEEFMLDAYRELLEGEPGVEVLLTAITQTAEGRAAIRVDAVQNERFTTTILVPGTGRTIAVTGEFDDESVRPSVIASLLTLTLGD